MASVLLVDDEKNIRSGLSAIISRTDSIFTDINECSNGRDALQLLSQRKFDLLITDLLMPQMDGMDLVANMDGMEEKPHTVILSGHDDFKYAQKAIDYGVMAYLLKPVDRNELIHVLKKAESEIVTRQNANKSGAMETDARLESRIRSLLLDNAVMHGGAGGFPAGELEAGLGCRQVAVLSFSPVYEAEGKREHNAVLEALLRKRLTGPDAKACCTLDHRGNVALVLASGVDVGELLEDTEKATGYPCVAGVAGFRPGLGLHACYQQAEYALRCRLMYSSERVVPYDAVARADGLYVLPVRLLKNLALMLDAERREDLCRLVERIFDIETLKKHQLDYTEKLSHALKDEIIHYLSDCIPHKMDFIQEQERAFRSIYEFADLQEYVRYIRGYVMNINNVLVRRKSSCISDNEIDRAIKYVRENYSKDLTMAEVANSISLNYSYFSLLFKGKTGMNFIDYLKSLRIEKAKDLLRSTDYKIYEISGMVGYNNTKHFTTMFRTFTGISPREYRDRICSIS